MPAPEWQEAYKALDQLHTDFTVSYGDYKNGSNQRVRSIAESKASHAIFLVKTYIERHPDISYLFLNSKFGQQFAQQEFFELRYFERDMSEFLELIKARIEHSNEAD